MPLISRTRLAELEYAEKQLEQIEEEDLKARRDYGRALEKQSRLLREQHEDQIEELESTHKADRKEYQEDSDRLVEEAQERADKAEAAQKKAETNLEAIKAVSDKEAAVIKREVALTTSETKLKAREEVADAREKAVTEGEKVLADKVTAHAKEVTDAYDAGHAAGEKKGYAEGASAMALKIKELTAADRKAVTDLATKALDGVVEAAKQSPVTPEVNVLAVPVAQSQAPQKQDKK